MVGLTLDFCEGAHVEFLALYSFFYALSYLKSPLGGNVNQMRSPLHPKIRIFDLERLRDVELNIF